MKLLVIGSGGREHALAWRLSQSAGVEKVFVAPGNAGTALEPALENIALKSNAELIEFVRREGVAFTVVGPEAPLAAGVVDDFRAAGLKIFGPTKAAAQLESSKDFAKAFMKRHHIPTADYETFTDPAAARAYVEKKGAPIVVKADGLAAGKGVVVAMTVEEAVSAIDSMLEGHQFGAAGARVVIEDFLEGEEASFIVMVDGEHILPLATSQDHKRLLDHDQGPNTGGMGVYSPVPIVTDEEHATMVDIMERAVAGLREEGIDYRGVLYGGFMLTPQGPKLLEFNARFGDPETQVVLPRLETDLVDVMVATAQQRLSEVELSWRPEWAVSVVLASEGYPGDYEKGREITGIDEANALPGVHVYHAGTKVVDGKVYTNGGRVLNVTALGGTFEEARDRAYEACDLIDWDGKFMRRDIGARAMRGRSAWES